MKHAGDKIEQNVVEMLYSLPGLWSTCQGFIYACALLASQVLDPSVPRPRGYAGRGIARGDTARQNWRDSGISMNSASKPEIIEVEGGLSNKGFHLCDEIFKV
jgi:hypothetical protein